MKRAKNIWLSVLGFALIAAGIYLIRTVPDPQGILRALPFLLVGFGCGIFGHGLGELLAKKAAESDPETARRMEIDQTDERNVMIGNMAKAKGYDMMTYVSVSYTHLDVYKRQYHGCAERDHRGRGKQVGRIPGH